jgi:hypothetical protein
VAGFVFTADCHLSRLIWQRRPTLVGDSWAAFSALIGYCVQEQAPLIIGGDLFDKAQPDSDSVVLFSREMQRMADARLPVYFTQGQHENARTPWALCHPWPQHVHGRTFQVPGVLGTFYGIDWQPLGVAAGALKAVPPDVTWLVTHQVWLEHMGDHITAPECSMLDVPAHVRYVLTGDYHVHQITAYPTTAGQQLLVSPGSLRPRNVADVQLPATAYHFNGSEFMTVSLPRRPAVVGTLAGPDDIPAFLTALSQAAAHAPDGLIGQPFAVARYDGQKWPQAYDTLQRAVPDSYHLFAIDTALGVLQMVTDAAGAPVTTSERPDARELLQRVVTTVAGSRGQADYVDDVLRLLLSTTAPSVAVSQYVADLLNTTPHADGVPERTVPDAVAAVTSA